MILENCSVLCPIVSQRRWAAFDSEADDLYWGGQDSETRDDYYRSEGLFAYPEEKAWVKRFLSKEMPSRTPEEIMADIPF